MVAYWYRKPEVGGSNPSLQTVAVAQLVVQRIVVPPVVGSSPIGHLCILILPFVFLCGIIKPEKIGGVSCTDLFMEMIISLI